MSGPRRQILAGRRSRFAMLALLAALLAAPGCVSTQQQARRESAERWNRARAQVKARLASDQLAAGHIEDAAADLAAAFQVDPTNPELLTLQARIDLARGDLAAAERLLERVEAQGQLRAEVEYLLGVIEEQRLHWSVALEHFARAADEDPQEVAYLVAIVQAMLQLGQAADALALLESYEAEFGWMSAYHAALAECYEQLEDWTRAASAWRKVLDANDDPGIRERLATALYRAGRWSQAIGHFERLLDEAETQPVAPLRLALAACLLENSQPEAAREQISFVLRDDSRNVTALQLMARVFVERGELEHARRTAERALQLAPDNLRSLELVAALAFRTGDTSRASLLARQVERLFPDSDSPIARQILERLSAPPPATEQ